MLSSMKIFITDEQKIELERLHDTTRSNGRVRDASKPFFSHLKAGVRP
ncbi:hypothetical protein ACFOGG_01140 [Brenneria rubrifaciens]